MIKHNYNVFKILPLLFRTVNVLIFDFQIVKISSGNNIPFVSINSLIFRPNLNGLNAYTI